ARVGELASNRTKLSFSSMAPSAGLPSSQAALTTRTRVLRTSNCYNRASRPGTEPSKSKYSLSTGTGNQVSNLPLLAAPDRLQNRLIDRIAERRSNVG